MIAGARLRALREEKKLSQGVVEERTGLLRCYISRVENGHTVPAVETLEKFARALEIPIYQLFYEGENPPKLPNLAKGKTANEWGSKGKDAQMLVRVLPSFRPYEKRRFENGAFMAQKMAKRKVRTK